MSQLPVPEGRTHFCFFRRHSIQAAWMRAATAEGVVAAVVVVGAVAVRAEEEVVGVLTVERVVIEMLAGPAIGAAVV